MSFSWWKNFKRHQLSKHSEEVTVYSCFICGHSTDRSDSLLDHIKKVHTDAKMVRGILEELLDSMFKDDDEEVEGGERINSNVIVLDELNDSGPTDGSAISEEACISEYKKVRNERVAELRAEFLRHFPEIAENVSKAPKRRRNNIKENLEPVRKSPRFEGSEPIMEKSQEDVVEEQSEDVEEQEHSNDGEPVEEAVAVEDNDEHSDLGNFGCVPCGRTFRDG